MTFSMEKYALQVRQDTLRVAHLEKAIAWLKASLEIADVEVPRVTIHGYMLNGIEAADGTELLAAGIQEHYREILTEVLTTAEDELLGIISRYDLAAKASE